MSDKLTDKVVKGVSWSFAEKILTEIVNFVISIVLARLLIPEDYGVVALIQVFVTLSTVFVSCGLGTALIQNKNATDKQISTIFYVNIIAGILLYGILFAVAPLIAAFYEKPILIPLFRVLSLRIPIASVYSVQQAYIQKNLAFKKFFYSSLAGTIVSGVVGIVLAYKGFGPWALVWAAIVDQAMDSIILFFTTKWLPKMQICISETTGMMKYGSKILLSELVSRGYEQIRLLVIGKVYSASDLAYNSKGQKFPQMIIETTNTTIVRVMFPTFATLQDDRDAMREAARKSIQVSTFVLAPLLIGLTAIADRFIPFLLTDNWIKCIPYLQLYCITYLFMPISSMSIKVIQACGKSGTALLIEIIKKSFGLICLVLAVLFFNDAIYVAASFTAMSILAVVVNAFPCKKLIDYGLGKQIADIIPSLALSCVMGITVYFVGMIPVGDFVAICIQCLVGAAIYIGGALLFRLSPALFIITYFKEKKEYRQ